MDNCRRRQLLQSAVGTSIAVAAAEVVVAAEKGLRPTVTAMMR